MLILSPPYKRSPIKNTKIFTLKSQNLDDDWRIRYYFYPPVSDHLRHGLMTHYTECAKNSLVKCRFVRISCMEASLWFDSRKRPPNLYIWGGRLWEGRLYVDYWHSNCKCLFKVIGGNGAPNTEKKVRLQLFQPPKTSFRSNNTVEVSSLASYTNKSRVASFYFWLAEILAQIFP